MDDYHPQQGPSLPELMASALPEGSDKYVRMFSRQYERTTRLEDLLALDTSGVEVPVGMVDRALRRAVRDSWLLAADEKLRDPCQHQETETGQDLSAKHTSEVRSRLSVLVLM